jgi:epoxyqueuosine reductase
MRSCPRLQIGSGGFVEFFPSQFQNPNDPQIAKYDFPETDYHLVLKSKLAELEQRIIEKYGANVVSHTHQHSFVDSAPILERRWAEQSGLGWIGKNTQLIHPGLGSFVFIGILLLNVETEYDSPVPNRCGTCTKCIDACPTKALENGSMDARRCISYLTIENKDKIAPEFQSNLSGYVLGCDICADVCPWNKKRAKPTSNEQLRPIKKMLEWDENEWIDLNENKFNETFRYSAVKRAGYQKLRQNIALFQSGKEK